MTPEDIQKIIERAVPQARAHVLDPMCDGKHLQAIVISPAFEGVPLVKQHQMVMKPLQAGFAGSVHALGLKTFTPDKWEQVRNQYQL
ncbi:MAG: BolA/IbaG family iron-sulfur metabolism protein [Candidatus Omnitrophica bacterium]|nr:BolA/IbaG family iron-sulfur metabolism protein [Candidatus Omnitrophota bacterium]